MLLVGRWFADLTSFAEGSMAFPQVVALLITKLPEVWDWADQKGRKRSERVQAQTSGSR
jgi:hypothetical protein